MEEFLMEQLTIAAFLSMVANRLVEGVAQPLKLKFPTLDTWWLVYVSWVVGGLLAYLSGINLFSAYISDYPIAGQILTAIVVGGGANLIKDLFPRLNMILLTEEKDASKPV
jgi:hypothetical protein